MLTAEELAASIGRPAGAVSLERVRSRLLRPLPEGDFRSVIVVLFPYWSGCEEGNISLYARGVDYHRVIPALLAPAIERAREEGADALCLVDISPLPEVYAAAAAGLGRIGRNGLLINDVCGSFAFIGCILTGLECRTSACRVEEYPLCASCGRCTAACPTGSLRGEGECLSAVTQERRELTEEEEKTLCRCGMAWGCDVCQLVCPANAALPFTDIAAFREGLRPSLRKIELEGLSDREFRRRYADKAFAYRGIKPLLRNLTVLTEGNENNG